MIVRGAQSTVSHLRTAMRVGDHTTATEAVIASLFAPGATENSSNLLCSRMTKSEVSRLPIRYLPDIP
jgi:hypothetical protein